MCVEGVFATPAHPLINNVRGQIQPACPTHGTRNDLQRYPFHWPLSTLCCHWQLSILRRESSCATDPDVPFEDFIPVTIQNGCPGPKRAVRYLPISGKETFSAFSIFSAVHFHEPASILIKKVLF